MQKIDTLSPFFVLALIMLFSSSISLVPITRSTSSTIMSALPPYILVKAEDDFTVSVVVTDAPPFIGFDATISFNVTCLEALSGNVTVPWEGCGLYIDNETGTVTITGFNIGNPLSLNQTLAMIEFHALEHSNSTLFLVNTDLTDPDYNWIPHTTEDAFVEIIGSLSLTVASTRAHYYVGTNIIIHGNATIAGSSENTLVGLELLSPKNTSIVRTVASGSDPPQGPWPINITDFYPSDNYGNHTNSFAAGSQAYFTVQIQSMANETLPYLICIDALNTYNASIGQTFSQGVIQPGSPSLLISAVYLPYDTYNGTATAYAEVFSDWPHNNGLPYCPGQSVSFDIWEGVTTKPRPVSYGNVTFQSDYERAFNLSSDYSFGNYSVYATADYKTQTAFVHTTFFNTVMCDFSGDGRVGSKDLTMFLVAFGSTPEKPKWFADADSDLDGRVGSKDLTFFLSRYGQHT